MCGARLGYGYGVAGYGRDWWPEKVCWHCIANQLNNLRTDDVDTLNTTTAKQSTPIGLLSLFMAAMNCKRCKRDVTLCENCDSANEIEQAIGTTGRATMA